MALTQKQEQFCRCVVSGMSYKDSYLTVYNTTSDTTAFNEGSKLALREDIQAYIKTLKKPLERAAQTEALNNRQQQIEYIKQRIALCEQKDDEQSIIRYTDMLNKINALYKDTETEVKTESTVNDLDIKTLRLLSGSA